MDTNLPLKEKLLLIFLAFLSAISLFLFFQYKSLAFPEYNINFEIDQNEAKEQSNLFLELLSTNLTTYKSVTIFHTNQLAKTYLERELSVERTAELSDQVNLWNFKTRFFEPSVEMEYFVSYTPGGRLVSFNIRLPEVEQSNSISETEAIAQAESFLIDRYSLNLEDWNLINKESRTLPNRIDHYFTWEKNNFTAKDATLRTEVRVSGDRLTSSDQYLKIPETWIRSYEQETSQNNLAQIVAEAASFLIFGLALLIVFILKFKSGELRVKFALIVAGVGALIAFLNSINNFPNSLIQYSTTESWYAFIATLFFVNLSFSMFQGMMLFLIIVTGEAIYREVFPLKLSLERLLHEGILSKNFTISLLVGSFAGFLMFSYVVAYYIIGQKFGYWVPADIDYADLFNTYIPWIYPVFIGFIAAATEEGIFRLFGISFLQKYLKRTWLAVFVTSVVWAFLHSNYPQSPWYARGIEITLVGIGLGYLFVRFGILASFVAHYIFNALQTAVFLFASNNLYIIFSSLLVALLPLLLGILLLGRYLLKGRFVDQESLINANVSIKVKKHNPEKEIIYSHLKYFHLSKLKIYLLIALAGVGLVLIYFFSETIFIKEIQNTLDRNSALKVAQKALEQERINYQDFNSIVTFANNTANVRAQEYILEQSNFQKLKEIYPDKIPTQLWTVRFYKPLQTEEYFVDILPDGTLYTVEYLLPEDSFGAKLTQEEALSIAIRFLQEGKNYNLEQLKLVEKNSENKPDRIDHIFEFEVMSEKVADANLRVHLDIIGDKPSGYSTYLKLPDNWLREKAEYNLKDFAAIGVITIFFGSIFIISLLTFLRFFRAQQLDIKFAAKISAVMTLLSIMGFLNNIPNFAIAYNTSIPFTTYTVQTILITLLSIVFTFVFSTILISLFTALWKLYLKGFFPEKFLDRKLYWRDALLSSYLLQFILGGFSLLVTYLLIKFNLLRTFPMDYLNFGYDQFIPFLAVITYLGTNLLMIILFGTLLLLLYGFFKSWVKVFVSVLLLISIATLIGKNSLSGYLINLIDTLLIFLGIVWIIFFIARNNIFSYLGFSFVGLTLISGLMLINQKSSFFQINGVILLIVSLLPIIIYTYKYVIKK